MDVARKKYSKEDRRKIESDLKAEVREKTGCEVITPVKPGETVTSTARHILRDRQSEVKDMMQKPRPTRQDILDSNAEARDRAEWARKRAGR